MESLKGCLSCWWEASAPVKTYITLCSPGKSLKDGSNSKYQDPLPIRYSIVVSHCWYLLMSIRAARMEKSKCLDQFNLPSSLLAASSTDPGHLYLLSHSHRRMITLISSAVS